MPSAPWVFWNWGQCQHMKFSIFSQMWSSCLPPLRPSSNNLPKNSELKYVQDHEYSLNKLPFAILKTCGLSPFVQVVELFLLSSPGSSRQSPCGYLQFHQIDQSTIYGETDMNQKALHKGVQFCQCCRENNLYNLLSFKVNETSICRSVFWWSLSRFS